MYYYILLVQIYIYLHIHSVLIEYSLDCIFHFDVLYHCIIMYISDYVYSHRLITCKIHCILPFLQIKSVQVFAPQNAGDSLKKLLPLN